MALPRVEDLGLPARGEGQLVVRLPAAAPARPGQPAALFSSNLSLGEAELLLLLSCNSWGGGGGLICSASLEVAEAVAVLLLQMKTNSEFSFF